MQPPIPETYKNDALRSVRRSSPGPQGLRSLFGLSRETATLFSFFLAVPTMIAAVSYDVYKSRHLLVTDDWAMLLIGFAAAFASGLLTVRGLLAYVARHDFRAFAWYRIAFGLTVLATWATGIIEWHDL